jgi:TM2 domain-containing membrane protein YozV
VLPPDRRGLHHHSLKGTTMTNPHPDANAAPPEGYDRPPAPPYQKESNPAGAQPQQPSPGQPQYQDSSPAPQQYQSQPPLPNPAFGQPPAPQQYQSQPPLPNPAFGQPPAPQQYQSQPPMPNQAYGYSQPKSKIVAGLLGIFLGALGIHRFYLGYTKIAVIQLVLTLVLGAFGLGIVGLWGVIEGIMILAGSSQFRADARGVRLRD